MSAYDDLSEAARQLMASFDELAIAEMCVEAQAELARLRAAPVAYKTVDGQFYRPDDIEIVRDAQEEQR